MNLPLIPDLSAARRNQRGVAIVVVLAMVVLLTTIIVAFFSRAVLDRQISNSNSKKNTADILARGALDGIVADLRQEIAAGSTISGYPAGNTNLDNLTLYLPKAANSTAGSTIVPASVPPSASNSSPANPLNVLKRSAAGQPFFSGANYNAAQFPPSNNASPVNSAGDPSPDGRFVSAARWDMAHLLDGSQLGDATKSAAVYNNYFAAPDWVLVTRGGPKAITALQSANTQGSDLTNKDYVVGRYAYVVYDEGGLVDINQAGYPNSLGSDADFTARRGRLAQVDLAQIPGVTNVDAIVQAFRNFKTATDAASYKKYVLNNFPANSGFLRVIPGDQTFVSRQDLLNFQQQNGSVLTTAALQYLGTFSRFVNAPSWTPAADAVDLPAPVAASNGPGSIYAYKTNAENGATGNKNPDFATVRFANAGTIVATRLLPARTVTAGEPMLKRRFFLNRLSWIGPTDPASNPATGPTPADIKRAFGLKFVSTGVWMYTSPDGDTLGTTIKSLNEVAALSPPREPDFFELLQAGMLNGSLGLYSGDRSYADTQREDKSFWRHVIQIGVNIIDQADTDSYPTTVQFNFSGDSPSIDSRYPDNYDIVGIEDLPYFSQIGGIIYRDNNGTSTIREQVYYPVELWNPHQASSVAYNGPSQLRVLVRAGTSIYKKYNANPQYSETPRDFGINPAEIDFPSVTSGLAVQNLFREPGMLSTTNSTSNDINNVAGTTFGQWLTILGASGKPFSNPASQNELVYFGILTATPNNPMPTFELQFKNVNGQWQTYQIFPGVVPGQQHDGSPTNIWPTFNQNSWVVAGFRADPRGMRLGFSQAGEYTKIPGGDYQHEANLSSSSDPTGSDGDMCNSYYGMSRTPNASYGPIFKNNEGAPFADNSNWTGGPFYPPLFAQNRSNGESSSYTDRDLVIRWGDGDRGKNVKPMMPGHSQDRPIMLNRPFRSVGEFGYAYRDVQWKTLDFSTIKSADAALLDLFTVDDADIIAGKVNLNTRQTTVLQAILTGAAKVEGASPVSLTSAEAAQIAAALTATTSAQAPYSGVVGGPLANPAELVTRPADVGNAKNWIADATSSPTTQIKTQREAAVRILASAGETRTWNLLIDVVAQSGRYTNGATRLSQFVAGGERRYWLHVAIDRYTGKIVDQQLESVNER